MSNLKFNKNVAIAAVLGLAVVLLFAVRPAFLTPWSLMGYEFGLGFKSSTPDATQQLTIIAIDD